MYSLRLVFIRFSRVCYFLQYCTYAKCIFCALCSLQSSSSLRLLFELWNGLAGHACMCVGSLHSER